MAERTTAFCMAEKLKFGKDSKELTKTVFRMLLPFKDKLYTITVDNGTEFADHQRLAKLLNTKIYFTHPYFFMGKRINRKYK